MKMRNRKMIIVGHYMITDCVKVEIDPFKTNLPDRCKLALAQMMTSHKFELIHNSYL